MNLSTQKRHRIFKNPPIDGDQSAAHEEEFDIQPEIQSSQNTLTESLEECAVVPNVKSQNTINNKSDNAKKNRRDYSGGDDETPKASSPCRRPTTSSQKGGYKTSRNYSLQEENAILDFIVSSNRFSEVKGNALWLMMESENVVTNRSSQSLKERFRRHIAPNLNKYSILSKKNIRKFKKHISVVSKQIMSCGNVDSNSETDSVPLIYTHAPKRRKRKGTFTFIKYKNKCLSQDGRLIPEHNDPPDNTPSPVAVTNLSFNKQKGIYSK